MGKTKQRQVVPVPTKQNNNSSRLIDSSNSDPYLDPHLETSWVIVKKQRVTILVPSLPVADSSPEQNLEPSQSQAVPRKRVDNRWEHPTETRPRLPAADEWQKTSMPAVSEMRLKVKKASTAQNFPTSFKPFRQDLRMEPVNQYQARTSVSHKLLGISKTSRNIMRPRLLLHGHSVSHDGVMPLNLRLRALNLERKLQKGGGLSRWLASLGLERGRVLASFIW